MSSIPFSYQIGSDFVTEHSINNGGDFDVWELVLLTQLNAMKKVTAKALIHINPVSQKSWTTKAHSWARELDRVSSTVSDSWEGTQVTRLARWTGRHWLTTPTTMRIILKSPCLWHPTCQYGKESLQQVTRCHKRETGSSSWQRESNEELMSLHLPNNKMHWLQGSENRLRILWH